MTSFLWQSTCAHCLLLLLSLSAPTFYWLRCVVVAQSGTSTSTLLPKLSYPCEVLFFLLSLQHLLDYFWIVQRALPWQVFSILSNERITFSSCVGVSLTVCWLRRIGLNALNGIGITLENVRTQRNGGKYVQSKWCCVLLIASDNIFLLLLLIPHSRLLWLHPFVFIVNYAD